MTTYLLCNRLKSTEKRFHNMTMYLTLIPKLYKSHHRGIIASFLLLKESTSTADLHVPTQQKLNLISLIISGTVLDSVAGQLWVTADTLFAEEIP